MKAQRIIYDQLNEYYCYDDVDQYLFLHSSKSPQSPYGPLTLNPHSQQIEHDASIQFIHELTQSGKSAQRQSVTSYDQ
jgi:hypothetical protein